MAISLEQPDSVMTTETMVEQLMSGFGSNRAELVSQAAKIVLGAMFIIGSQRFANLVRWAKYAGPRR